MKHKRLTAMFLYGLSVLCLGLYVIAYRGWIFLLLCALAFSACGFSYGGSRILCKLHPASQTRILHITFAGFFLLYGSLLLYLTLGEERGYLDQMKHLSTLQYFLQTSNFYPFQLLRDFQQIPYRDANAYFRLGENIVGNLVLFTPMAFFLPLFCKACRKLTGFCIGLCSTVLLIEVTQALLRYGVFDVDDLILNIGGGMLAFWLLRFPKLHSFLKRSFTKILF